MAEERNWKAVLKESNAIGWIAFFVLVISIGVGTIMFDSGDKPLRERAAEANASGQNYLK